MVIGCALLAGSVALAYRGRITATRSSWFAFGIALAVAALIILKAYVSLVQW
jgi:hypothetical protein